eukprot:g71520.t1
MEDCDRGFGPTAIRVMMTQPLIKGDQILDNTVNETGVSPVWQVGAGAQNSTFGNGRDLSSTRKLKGSSC